jgi:hypothetical protein
VISALPPGEAEADPLDPGYRLILIVRGVEDADRAYDPCKPGVVHVGTEQLRSAMKAQFCVVEAGREWSGSGLGAVRVGRHAQIVDATLPVRSSCEDDRAGRGGLSNLGTSP